MDRPVTDAAAVYYGYWSQLLLVAGVLAVLAVGLMAGCFIRLGAIVRLLTHQPGPSPGAKHEHHG